MKYLIDEWKQAYRFLSTWVAAVWAALLGVFAAYPTLAVDIWTHIPDDLRPDVPRWGKAAILAAIAFSTYVGARLLKQKHRPIQNKE